MSDRQYLHFSWHWVITGTDETAMTGLNWGAELVPPVSAATSLAEIDIATLGLTAMNAMNTLMTTGGINWAFYSHLVFFRVAAVGTDGIEIGDAKLYEDATERKGAAGAALPQGSIVVSTRSGLSTGAANFGRMFLPHAFMSLETGTPSASGAVTAAVATAAQSFMATLTTALNAETTGIYLPMIITHKDGAASKVIEEVAVGDVNDTQRRRRRQLPENYVFRSVPA